MGYFPVRYDSRVIIYERKMFIRLATGLLKIPQSSHTTEFVTKVVFFTCPLNVLPYFYLVLSLEAIPT